MKTTWALKELPSRERCGGAILILTLWIVFFLAALVLVFAHTMRTEVIASRNQVAALEAAAAERGAEQYAIALVDQEKDSISTLPESTFRALRIGTGFCWFLRPNYGDVQLPSYGLVDEASKVNLNSVPSSILLGLPGMTAELAAAIVDWRDADSDVSTGGAEDQYYLSLPEPYRCKNSTLETVEETLLIRGMTTDLLFGLGMGGLRGGALGWSSSRLMVRSDLETARGLFDYVTVYSTVSSASSTSQQRVNVNDDDERRLSDMLKEVFGAARASEIAAKSRPRPPFRDIFDYAVRAGVSPQELESIADRITTSARPPSTGLINVNTAPRQVLLCLPGLSEGDVTNLTSRRQSATKVGSIAWVLDALGPKAVGLGNWITGRSSRYSADIVTVSEDGRAYKRCRIVLDAGRSPPRILYRTDLTDFGWPLDLQIILSLRAGNGLPPSAYSTNRGAF